NHNCAKTYHQLRTNSFDKADDCWSSDQRRGTESDRKASFLDCAETIPPSGWQTLPLILCVSEVKDRPAIPRGCSKGCCRRQVSWSGTPVTHCGSVKQKK